MICVIEYWQIFFINNQSKFELKVSKIKLSNYVRLLTLGILIDMSNLRRKLGDSIDQYYIYYLRGDKANLYIYIKKLFNYSPFSMKKSEHSPDGVGIQLV